MEIKKNPFQVMDKTFWEISELSDKELSADKYHAMECKVMGMQIVNSANVKNGVTGQTDPMLAVVAQVVIPVDPRLIQSGLLTPDGMTHTFHKACPIPPNFRIVINEEYLSKSYIPEKEQVEKPDMISLDDFMRGVE
tara:strand:+ start:9774 stop:10184 length:411 start_codon:yes stop_codon:yes gene_type:complete